MNFKSCPINKTLKTYLSFRGKTVVLWLFTQYPYPPLPVNWCTLRQKVSYIGIRYNFHLRHSLPVMKYVLTQRVLEWSVSSDREWFRIHFDGPLLLMSPSFKLVYVILQIFNSKSLFYMYTNLKCLLHKGP